MTDKEETNENPEKIVRATGRKSSLRMAELNVVGIRRNPNKRNTVSWGKNNYKNLKAQFEEDIDPVESKITKRKWEEFDEKRKKSIQGEFTDVKEMLKHQESIAEEEDEEKNEELIKNTNYNKQGNNNNDNSEDEK